MKTILTICCTVLLTIIAIGIAAMFFFKDLDYVHNLDYQQFKIEVFENFDSVKTDVRIVKEITTEINSDVDTIKSDVKTLKKGQSIIYDEVKKNTSSNFWNLF